MEKTIKIPEGFELVFDGKDTYTMVKIDEEKKWENFPNKITGYYITSRSEIRNIDNVVESNDDYRNIFPAKEYAEAALALSQLLQWRKVVIGDWKPIYEVSAPSKYCIIVVANKVIWDIFLTHQKALSFPTKELCIQFMEDHKSLLEVAKPLL